MSKKTHRPTRKARKQHKQRVKEARKVLHQQQVADGVYERPTSVSNALCPCRTVEEEQALREEVVAAQIGAWRPTRVNRPRS